MLRLHILPIAIILTIPLALPAQPPNDASYDALAKSFKPLLINALPKTLYERTDNWDHTVMVPVGLKWRGLKAEVSKSPRNHGEWRKLIVSTQDLPRTLDLKVYDVRNINSEMQTFKAFFTFQMGVYYEQQNWESGIRLWSGSAVARAQVKLDMQCEHILKVTLDKNNLPDFTLRLRVTQARLSYDNLVFEHINGIGGDGAKILGKAAHRFVSRHKPSFERDLLERANAAIVKAADTKEIRVGFGGLMKSK